MQGTLFGYGEEIARQAAYAELLEHPESIKPETRRGKL